MVFMSRGGRLMSERVDHWALGTLPRCPGPGDGLPVLLRTTADHWGPLGTTGQWSECCYSHVLMVAALLEIKDACVFFSPCVLLLCWHYIWCTNNLFSNLLVNVIVDRD